MVIFTEVSCCDTDFRGVTARDVDFSGGNFGGSKWSASTLRNVNFSRANLISAKLNTDLGYTILDDALHNKQFRS